MKKYLEKNGYGRKYEIYLKELQSKVDTSKKYTVDAFEMIVEGLGK